MRLFHLATIIMIICEIVLFSQNVQAKEEKDEAANAFAKGTALFKERDFMGSIAEFERAYQLRPHFAVQCSIARCYENMNRFFEAADHYRRCLKEGAGNSPIGDKIRTTLKNVETHITWVEVTSPGKGGVIFVDGIEMGSTPQNIRLNPGSHHIEVQRPLAKPARVTFTTPGGEHKSLELVPYETPPSVPKSASRLVISTPSPKLSPFKSKSFLISAALTTVFTVTAVSLSVVTLNQRNRYETSPSSEGYLSFEKYRLLSNIFWSLSSIGAGASTVFYFYGDIQPPSGVKNNHQEAFTSTLGIQGEF